jgi:hypothetical protein
MLANGVRNHVRDEKKEDKRLAILEMKKKDERRRILMSGVPLASNSMFTDLNDLTLSSISNIGIMRSSSRLVRQATAMNLMEALSRSQSREGTQTPANVATPTQNRWQESVRRLTAGMTETSGGEPEKGDKPANTKGHDMHAASGGKLNRWKKGARLLHKAGSSKAAVEISHVSALEKWRSSVKKHVLHKEPGGRRVSVSNLRRPTLPTIPQGST